MTQISWFWSGIATGDSTSAPYSDDEWSDIWRKLFTRDRTAEGVVGGYANELEVTNPAGTTVRVATGAALVDGKFYETDANVDNAAGAAGQYTRIVLRKSWAAHTVRVASLGPGGAQPALTQTDGTTWEIPLATIYNNGGTVEITDEREIIHMGTEVSADMLGDGIGSYKIEDDEIGAGGGSIDWDNIPQTYTHLMILFQAKDDDTVALTVEAELRFNNDNGGNYDYFETDIDISSASSYAGASAQSVLLAGRVFTDHADNPNSEFGTSRIYIPFYAGTNIYKNIQVEWTQMANGAAAPSAGHNYGVWKDTSAISRIQIAGDTFGDFVQYSRFTLYGIK